MKYFGILCIVFAIVAGRPIEYDYGASKFNDTLSVNHIRAPKSSTPTITHVSSATSISYFTHVILGVFIYCLTLGLAFAAGYYRINFWKPQVNSLQSCYGYGDNTLKKKHQKEKLRVPPMSDWI